MKLPLTTFLLAALLFSGTPSLYALPSGYGRAVFSVNVPYSLVTIDGKTLETGGKGTVSIALKAGSYDYKVSSDRYYYGQSGTAVINSGEEVKLNVALRPAFGSIAVDDESGDYAGTDVFVDDIYCGKLPCSVTKLSGGTHLVRMSKKNYLPCEISVEVREGEEVALKASFVPNYAPVKITTTAGAEISANGENLGRGEWSGILEAGVYLLESTMPYYVPGSKEVELAAGGEQIEISLPAPQPQYGSLKLECSPSFFTSTVYVDGEEVGRIPLFIERMMAGGHNVRVDKKSGGSIVSLGCSVTVTPGQIMTVTESMLVPLN